MENAAGRLQVGEASQNIDRGALLARWHLLSLRLLVGWDMPYLVSMLLRQLAFESFWQALRSRNCISLRTPGVFGGGAADVRL